MSENRLVLNRAQAALVSATIDIVLTRGLFGLPEEIARLSAQLDEANRTGAKRLDVTDKAELVERLLSTAVGYDKYGDDRRTSAARALLKQCRLVSLRLGPAVLVDRLAAAALDPRISLRQTIRLIASATRAYREAGGKDKNVSALHEIVKSGRVGPEKAEESLTLLKNARQELALTDPEYYLFDGALKAIGRRLPRETPWDSADFSGLLLRDGHRLVGPDDFRSVLSSDHPGFYYAKAHYWTERESPVILRVERTLAIMVAYARELRDSRFLEKMRDTIYAAHPSLHLRERGTVTLGDVFSASSGSPWFTDALVKFSGHPRVQSSVTYLKGIPHVRCYDSSSGDGWGEGDNTWVVRVDPALADLFHYVEGEVIRSREPPNLSKRVSWSGVLKALRTHFIRTSSEFRSGSVTSPVSLDELAEELRNARAVAGPSGDKSIRNPNFIALEKLVLEWLREEKSRRTAAPVATATPVVKRPRHEGFFGQADVTDPSVREAVDEEMASRREGAQRRVLVLRAQRVAITWGLGEAAVTLGRLDATQLDRLLRSVVKRPDGRNLGPDERLALTVAIHHPDVTVRERGRDILAGLAASMAGIPGSLNVVGLGAGVISLPARSVMALPLP